MEDESSKDCAKERKWELIYAETITGRRWSASSPTSHQQSRATPWMWRIVAAVIFVLQD